MSRLEFLRKQRNSLVDIWIAEENEHKMKILVQIMDLEEDINQLLQEQKLKKPHTMVS